MFNQNIPKYDSIYQYLKKKKKKKKKNENKPSGR